MVLLMWLNSGVVFIIMIPRVGVEKVGLTMPILFQKRCVVHAKNINVGTQMTTKKTLKGKTVCQDTSKILRKDVVNTIPPILRHMKCVAIASNLNVKTQTMV